MAKENTQSITQQKALNETQNFAAIMELGDVPPIITEVDFKPYLEAVNMAAQRTRSIIYVLVAALLLVFTAYRNTSFPDWTDLRLTRLQEASVCLEANRHDADCNQSIEYAKGFLLQGSSSIETTDLTSTQEFKLELREQINAFIKQRTDALSLRLPFFGITIDLNDLGVVVGFLLVSILYVLYASLKSEVDNIEVAKGKIKRIGDRHERKDNIDLLLMAQVLATPAKSGTGVRKVIYALLILVPIPHLFVLKSDLETYTTAAVLEGPRWAKVETFIDFIAFALIVFCVYQCVRQQRKLSRSLDDLAPPESEESAMRDKTGI